MDGTLKKRKRETHQAFLLYTADWLSSTAIELMTAGEERGFFRLLMHEWQSPDCGLPDDDRTLAVLSKLGAEWEAGSGAVLRRQFVPRGGRLFNERLLEERAYQDKVRSARSEAAKTANAVRWSSNSEPSRITDGSQTDPNRNRKPKPETIKTVPEPDGAGSHMLTTENITEAQRALAAHRGNGSAPDEKIIRRILGLFDSMAVFRSWIGNIGAAIDPSRITSSGYALYFTNAQRWIGANGNRLTPKPTKYFDVTTITGPSPKPTKYFDPTTITGETPAPSRSTMDPETRRRIDEWRKRQETA
jgi:uncharacterized protein YdaU (DUF1376 family)